MRQVLPSILDELLEIRDREIRVAWFQPTFHLPCGVVLLSGGLSTFCTEVHRPGAPRFSWLSPIWSQELVWLPSQLHRELTARIDAFETISIENGVVLDGCPYRLEWRRAEGPASRAGNLATGDPIERALGQAVVEAALTWARWDSTRTGFQALQLYVR